jgi:WD40 repeat protein
MVSRPFEVRFTAPVGTSVISASCTANFSLIVAGAVDRQLHALGQDGKSIWDTRLDHEVWATAISADGTRIAAGTANKNPSDGTVYVFNSNKKALWQKKIGAPVWGVALSANGSVLAVTAWDGNLYLFREKKGEWALVGKEAISQSGAYGISISDDGSVIAVVAYEEGLHFYDSNLKKLGEIKNNNFGYRAALTRDGKVVIAGLRNGEVSLSERLGRKRTKSVKLSQRPICGVAITPNAKLCVAGGFDGHVHVLNEALESLWTYRTEGEVWAVDVSDDGRFICVASGDGSKNWGIWSQRLNLLKSGMRKMTFSPVLQSNMRTMVLSNTDWLSSKSGAMRT